MTGGTGTGNNGQGRPAPKLPIETVVLDVDGTILRPNLTIHRRTVEAVAACRARGVLVMVATGRRLATARGYAREVGADLELVALDGAILLDGRHSVVRERPIDAEAAHRILAWVREMDVVVAAQTREHVYGSRRRAPWQVLREASRRGVFRTLAGTRHTLWEIPNFRAVRSLDAQAEAVFKISPLGPREAVLALRERIESATDLPVRLTTPGSGYEIVARGVSKGEGLIWLLGQLGRDPAHTLAIGDGWNDVEMFDRVGHPVAMQNAHPGVRARARWVTAHVEEEGVAEVLEMVTAGSWPPEDGDLGGPNR